MTRLWEELEEQPGALCDLGRFYREGPGREALEACASALPGRGDLILTGMGASYHAAWIAALHLNSLGLPAQAYEAADLLHYAAPVLQRGKARVIYLSQSGSSPEVEPLLDILDRRSLVAVTNQPGSPLAQAAAWALPLQAGPETLIASKTYANSLALGWLVARRLANRLDESDFEIIARVAETARAILQAPLPEPLAVAFQNKQLAFLGHGPHAATARQAAMLVSEWTKRPTASFSAGGFRHGFIEMGGSDLSAILFSPASDPVRGLTQELAVELQSYGLRVALITQGHPQMPGERLAQPAAGWVDEYLAPILDILPIQKAADREANHRLAEPGFRHIQKVIKKL